MKNKIFDPDYGSALEAAAAKAISSLELDDPRISSWGNGGNISVHLGAFDFSMKSPAVQEQTRADMQGQAGGFARGALSGFAEWQIENRKRLGYRALWERYLRTWTCFCFRPQSPPPSRTIPQSSAPAKMIPFPEGGAQPDWNLPVGLQIMAPYLEDATSIAFARLLAREIEGFQPPPVF